MRSFTTTLIGAFLLLFFSTAASAYKYRKFPYSVECDGNRRDVNRYELKDAARDSIEGKKKHHPYWYSAHKYDKAGNVNCRDLSLPLYRFDLKLNGLMILYAFDQNQNTLWYCGYELYDNLDGQYNCDSNYKHHTVGSDKPPSITGEGEKDDDEEKDDGKKWSRR